jgi:hypothetical protein
LNLTGPDPSELDGVECRLVFGEFEQAARRLERLTRDYPSDFLTEKLTSVYFKFGWEEKALKRFRAMAQHLLERGSLPSAVNAYRTVLRLDAQDSLALQKLEELEHLEQPVVARDRNPRSPAIFEGHPAVDTVAQEECVTREQLLEALASKTYGGNIGSALIRLASVKPVEKKARLLLQYGIPSIDLRSFEIDPAACHLIPAETAFTCSVVPVLKRGALLLVAMADPLNSVTTDELCFMTGYQILPLAASHAAIVEAIQKHYRGSSHTKVSA